MGWAVDSVGVPSLGVPAPPGDSAPASGAITRRRTRGRTTLRTRLRTRCVSGQRVVVTSILGCSTCHEVGVTTLKGPHGAVNSSIGSIHGLVSGGNRIRRCFPRLINITSGGPRFVAEIGGCLGGVFFSIHSAREAVSMSFHCHRGGSCLRVRGTRRGV